MDRLGVVALCVPTTRGIRSIRMSVGISSTTCGIPVSNQRPVGKRALQTHRCGSDPPITLGPLGPGQTAPMPAAPALSRPDFRPRRGWIQVCAGTSEVTCYPRRVADGAVLFYGGSKTNSQDFASPRLSGTAQKFKTKDSVSSCVSVWFKRQAVNRICSNYIILASRNRACVSAVG
jgi:hypothetical protein